MDFSTAESQMKSYICTDTFITAVATFALLKFLPLDSLVNVLPIPGFGDGTTIGNAVITTVIASLVSGYVSKEFCKKM